MIQPHEHNTKLTSSEYDAQALNALKDVFKTYHGQTAPPVQLQKESAAHKAICLLKAQGFTNVEIARELGYTPQHVNTVCRQPWFLDKLGEIQATLGISTVKNAIERASMEAFETIHELMLNAEKESVRAQCAMDILNRHLGKAPQTVEVTNKSLVQYEDITGIDKELLEINTQLAQLENAKPVEGSVKTLNECAKNSG